MPDKVFKRSDFSRKDIKISAGQVRIKTASYNIISDNGAGSPAVFDGGSPLSYWVKPTDPIIDATANVKFSGGEGRYSFNGTTWVLSYYLPFVTGVIELDLGDVPIYDSEALARAVEGSNVLFKYSTTNSSGIPSENDSALAITK